MYSYITVYLKFSTGNSITGKRGHWPASEDISLPYLTYILSNRVLAGY